MHVRRHKQQELPGLCLCTKTNTASRPYVIMCACSLTSTPMAVRLISRVCVRCLVCGRTQMFVPIISPHLQRTMDERRRGRRRKPSRPEDVNLGWAELQEVRAPVCACVCMCACVCVCVCKLACTWLHVCILFAWVYGPVHVTVPIYERMCSLPRLLIRPSNRACSILTCRFSSGLPAWTMTPTPQVRGPLPPSVCVCACARMRASVCHVLLCA